MRNLFVSLIGTLALSLAAPAFATVSSTVTRNEYVGNGSAATYSYTFLIFSASDLAVSIIDTSGNVTNLSYPADYSVTGMGLNAGGSITLTGGNLTSGYGLVIRRNRALLQSTNIRNQGAYYPETIENTFDDLVIRSQQQQDEINRCIQFPETMVNFSSTFNPAVPTPVPANSTLSTDVTGTHLVWGPSFGTGGVVPISEGGTGQGTKSTGFDALAPTTSTGDLIYYGSGTNTRLAGPASTTKQYLTSTGTGASAQAPAWGTIQASDLPTVPITAGGTGQTTKSAAFDALSPNAATGDLTYYGSGTNSKLSGNTSATKKFLSQTGTGTASQAPAWATLSAGDIPPLSYVSSVGLSVPGVIFGLSGSPVTGTGTISLSLLNQSANTVFAGPSTGAAAAPSFRTLASADIPAINLAATGSGGITGLLPLGNLAQGGAISSQALVWNGSVWAPGNVGGGALTPTGSAGSPQSITAAGGIAFTGGASRSIWYVQGSGGAVTVTASPQVAAGSTTDQQEVLIVGTSDTNTVTLSDGTGLSLNGPVTLRNGSNIYLYWNGSVWSEITRRQ